MVIAMRQHRDYAEATIRAQLARGPPVASAALVGKAESQRGPAGPGAPPAAAGVEAEGDVIVPSVGLRLLLDPDTPWDGGMGTATAPSPSMGPPTGLSLPAGTVVAHQSGERTGRRLEFDPRGGKGDLGVPQPLTVEAMNLVSEPASLARDSVSEPASAARELVSELVAATNYSRAAYGYVMAAGHMSSLTR